MLKIQDIIFEIEAWAPPAIAWDRDNVGLQIGNPEEAVTGVLAALEVTPDVIQEAMQKKCNLMITHHPLIFNPLKNLTNNTFTGKLALSIAQNKLNLYSAHTNLDFTQGGVNFVLGKKLALQDVGFLYQEPGSMKKISVFVPPDYVNTVTDAMTKAGAGIIGNYEACSFQIKGTGTFRPLSGSQPFSGEVGKLQHEDEIRIEMVSPAWKIKAVLSAMTDAHPYDEVAYDVYPNEAIDPMYGAGIIGSLQEKMSVEDFITHVKKSIAIPAVRWSRGRSDFIKRVAICGGSGSELLRIAIQKNADAFVTADIKYHVFHEARGIIHLIDAGHYETEHHIVEAIVNRLQEKFRDINCYRTASITNPIIYS
jgi:dinuclear metal center YbgI/SA1388 family protein